MGDAYHIPVMVKEVLDCLRVASGGIYVDCTLGGGGHSNAILENGGSVIGIDRDADAIRFAGGRLSRFGDRFRAHRARFSQMLDIVGQDAGAVDGVLMDLGVSSRMIDDPSRGFSYRADGPLRMTMDESGTSAFDIINTYDEHELARMFRTFGEERNALRIARAIVRAKKSGPIRTTVELADIIEKAAGGPAPQKTKSRIFQALRIYINDELGELERGLADSLKVLKPGGRLCVISYHSLEDRMVKRFMRDNAAPCVCPPGLPCVCGLKPLLKVITRKPVTPSDAETAENPRARSALLRAAERTGEAA